MPNATDDRFMKRYRQPPFPVVEKGGLIFVYLGPPEEKPPISDGSISHLKRCSWRQS